MRKKIKARSEKSVSKRTIATKRTVSTKTTHPFLPSKLAYIKGILGWSLVIAFVFAMLSLISSSYSDHPKKTVFREKLPQASLLTFSDDDIHLLAVGDVQLGRYVELKMRQRKDYTYPFQNVAEFLQTADITFGNLDAPLVHGKNTPQDSFFLRADPEAVEGLKFAGFDVMSIANNQTMNYGPFGLVLTLSTLLNSEITPIGAGSDIDMAHTPAIVEVKGKKIAFYGYVDPSIPPGQLLNAARSGKAGVALMDIEAVKNDVKNALKETDIVIVSMHAGSQFAKQPTSFQRDFAHAAIDAGASVVIGHHPHVIQPIEWYKDGVIFYSLGNFVSDQFFNNTVRTGLLADIIFGDEAKPKRAELFPIRLDSIQPKILEGKEREEMLKKLGL